MVGHHRVGRSCVVVCVLVATLLSWPRRAEATISDLVAVLSEAISVRIRYIMLTFRSTPRRGPRAASESSPSPRLSCGTWRGPTRGPRAASEPFTHGATAATENSLAPRSGR